MDRSEIKRFSDLITLRYAKMLAQMKELRVQDDIAYQTFSADLVYLKLDGLAKSTASEINTVARQMRRICIGLHAVGAPLAVTFASTGSELSVFMGTTTPFIATLRGIVVGAMPWVLLRENEGGATRLYDEPLPPLAHTTRRHGGFVKGNVCYDDSRLAESYIEAVARGMCGREWAICIYAIPENASETLKRQQAWLKQATECSILAQVTFASTDNMETATCKQEYFEGEQYIRVANSFCEKAQVSVSSGEWCTTVNFSALTIEDARTMAGLITASLAAEDSGPEPIHAMYRGDDASVLLADGSGLQHFNFLDGAYPYPMYSNLLNSEELAVMIMPPSEEMVGLPVIENAEFDIDRKRSGELSIGTIIDKGRRTDSEYSLDPGELNRHCLVTGLTGSGKTNTLKNLLYQLCHKGGYNAMVIEPAKREYWELYKLGFDDLEIYSIGSNSPNLSKLCINPFERAAVTCVDGTGLAVPIQTHIDFVFAAFKASFIMYTPMPYVLERAIYEIYEDCGWDVHGNANRLGVDKFPTIEDLYFKIPEVVEAMGYDQRMRNDLIGSLQARIDSLRLGAKGDALNVERSYPIGGLLSGHVIVELEDIGDDDVKSFVISLLLINLLEYRRQQEDMQRGLRHVLLIEEAHRLLKNVQGGTGENADPRAAAVDFFCNLLAELRSKGQGFIIADQIPSKLAPDLLKNTNLKITHRTVDAEERALVGGSMHMSDDQMEYLATLEQGTAAAYSEGDRRPKLVRPEYVGAYERVERRGMKRDDVLAAIAPNCYDEGNKADYKSLTNARSRACRKCAFACGGLPGNLLNGVGLLDDARQLARELDPDKTKTCRASEIYKAIEDLLDKGTGLSERERRMLNRCVFSVLLDCWKLKPTLEGKLVNVYFSGKKES